MGKKIDRICQNCKLFDPRKSQCAVVILHEGQKVNLPVDEKDSCFFEENYFDPTTKALESFADDLKEVKFWVEDDKGQKIAGDGIVKMEYPEGFFGSDIEELYPENSQEFKDWLKELFPED